MVDLAPEHAALLDMGAVPLSATVEAASPPAGAAVPAGGEMAIAGEAHDSASRFDQLALWTPSRASADQDLLPEKSILDARSRDILRNDGYAAGGATLHKDNIVGAQFLLNATPATRILFGSDDDVWEREFQEEVETKFSLYAEGPNCWADAKRTKTLTELVRLSIGVFTAGGEVIASGEWMPNDGRPFRSAMQMIDPDRLDTPWNRRLEQNIRRGVEVDRRGAPVAYHFRMAHPSDYVNPDAYKWRRVMAYKPGWGRQQILHTFEENRPEQTRGVAAMVAALMEMKMTKGIRKVELQRAVVAATYAASFESDLPSGDVATLMGADEKSHPGIEWMKSYLNEINDYAGGSKNLTIDGQRIPILPPGTRLNLQSPGSTGPMGDKFEQSLLRYVAATLGLSYEQLSRDYTKTNYSSARAAMGETWKFMQSRKRMVADKTANFIYRLWLEEAINYDNLECLKRRRAPNFYEGQNADAYSHCEWIGAGRGMIDPLKETQAYKLQASEGFTSRQRVIAQIHGSDWRREFRQIAREKEEAERYGLTWGDSQEMDAALGAEPDAREPREDQ